MSGADVPMRILCRVSPFGAAPKPYMSSQTSGHVRIRGWQHTTYSFLIGGNAPLSGTPLPAEPSGPDAAAFKAQDRVLAAGKKLSDQEKFKREQHPFDSYE